MYDDLCIVIKPIEQLNTLQKDKILIILFKKDGVNVFSLMGKDRYYVKFASNKLSYFQINNDDGTLREHNLASGTIQTKRTDRDQAWIPTGYIGFVGKQVSADVWSQALTKFANEMQ